MLKTQVVGIGGREKEECIGELQQLVVCGEGETKTVGTVSRDLEATASEKGAAEPYSSQEADQ